MTLPARSRSPGRTRRDARRRTCHTLPPAPTADPRSGTVDREAREARVALLAALLIHLLLITITFPSFRGAARETPSPQKIVYVSRWVPPQPERQVPVP